MNRTHNEKLTGNAKVLRKNMTKEERHLWYDFLKTLPIMVHRQKVIGSYIVDFYIAEPSWLLNWTDRSTLKLKESKQMRRGMNTCGRWG